MFSCVDYQSFQAGPGLFENPHWAYLVYHVVMMSSCEFGESHLVILARDDGRRDVMTDGFKPR